MCKVVLWTDILIDLREDAPPLITISPRTDQPREAEIPSFVFRFGVRKGLVSSRSQTRRIDPGQYSPPHSLWPGLMVPGVRHEEALEAKEDIFNTENCDISFRPIDVSFLDASEDRTCLVITS